MELINIIYKQLELKISGEYAMKAANLILNNKLIVRVGHVPTNLDEIPDYLIFNDNFNWNLKLGNKTNIAMFDLHSFEPIKYLIQAYNQTNDYNYLEKSVEIIESWHGHLNKSESKYSWYDHCVSERTIVVILLKLHFNRLGVYSYDELFNDFLLRHQEYLKNPKNHIFGNHGLMVDRSLYLVTKILGNDNNNFNINLARNRIHKLFNASFTQNGINVENSISYHIFNLDLFLLIEKYIFSYYGDSISEDFDFKIERSIKYLAVITQPNGKFPNIGDGVRNELKKVLSRKTGKIYRENEYLNGSKNLEEKSYFFEEDGKYYYNDRESFISFKSGKKYNNHKHADDLSLTYSYKEDDVLVDCGTYTYQRGVFRNHFLSAKSHNALLVNNQSYNFLSKEFEKVSLLYFEENEEYTYVVGKNDLYDTVNLTRHLIITKNKSIIIYDDIQSDFDDTVTQNFNLHPDFNDSILHVDENRIAISHSKSRRYLVIRQYLDTEVHTDFGDIQKANYGLYSEKFLKVIPIYNVRFSSKESEFLTQISYANNEVLSLKKYNNKISFIENEQNIEINLFLTERNKNDLVFVENTEEKNNVFEFRCIHNLKLQSPRYAWYIFKNGKVFDKIWYSESNILEYEFKESGSYRIQYYIIDKLSKEKIVKWYGETIEI